MWAAADALGVVAGHLSTGGLPAEAHYLGLPLPRPPALRPPAGAKTHLSCLRVLNKLEVNLMLIDCNNVYYS
jgi:hypothetical protein